jgi:hypothetical protein
MTATSSVRIWRRMVYVMGTVTPINVIGTVGTVKALQ